MSLPFWEMAASSSQEGSALSPSDTNTPEAVFLVVCNPSMNEL
jgi:hypothetical protein